MAPPTFWVRANFIIYKGFPPSRFASFLNTYSLCIHIQREMTLNQRAGSHIDWIERQALSVDGNNQNLCVRQNMRQNMPYIVQVQRISPSPSGHWELAEEQDQSSCSFILQAICIRTTRITSEPLGWYSTTMTNNTKRHPDWLMLQWQYTDLC